MREGGLPPVGEDSATVQDVGEELLESGVGWDAESHPDVGLEPPSELEEDFWRESEQPRERSMRKRGVNPPRRFEDYTKRWLVRNRWGSAKYICGLALFFWVFLGVF